MECRYTEVLGTELLRHYREGWARSCANSTGRYVDSGRLHKPGDGLLTRDAATGLEWLDLTATTNMSVEEVRANLQKGGQFEGFEYATADQVADLLANAGLLGYGTDLNTTGGNPDTLQTAAATKLHPCGWLL